MESAMDMTVSRKRAQSDPSDKEEIKRLHTSIIRINGENEEVFALTSTTGPETVNNVSIDSQSQIPPGQLRHPSHSSVASVSGQSEQVRHSSNFSFSSVMDSQSQLQPGQRLPSSSSVFATEDHPTHNRLSTQEALYISSQDTSPGVSHPHTSVPTSELSEILTLVRQLTSDNLVLKQQLQEVNFKFDNYIQSTAQVTTQSTAHSPASLFIPNSESAAVGAPINQPKPANLDQLKIKVVPNWGRRFGFRRREYKNMDKNFKRSQIYEQFLNEEGGLYIVKRSRPKFAKNAQDYKLAESLSEHEMKIQSDRWNAYAEESRHKFLDVDNQIYNLINKHSVPSERELLLSKWAEEVKIAENKAQVMNQKELAFMINLPSTDPYSGFVASAADHRPNNRGFYKKDYYRGRKPQDSHAEYRNRYTPQQTPARSTPQQTPARSNPLQTPARSNPLHTPARSIPHQTPAIANPAFVSPWTSNSVTPFTPSSQINTAVFHMPVRV